MAAGWSEMGASVCAIASEDVLDISSETPLRSALWPRLTGRVGVWWWVSAVGDVLGWRGFTRGSVRRRKSGRLGPANALDSNGNRRSKENRRAEADRPRIASRRRHNADSIDPVSRSSCFNFTPH